MSDGAIITMILILGIVWGGFLLLLIYALRREAGKSRRDGAREDANAREDDIARQDADTQDGGSVREDRQDGRTG